MPRPLSIFSLAFASAALTQSTGMGAPAPRVVYAADLSAASDDASAATAHVRAATNLHRSATWRVGNAVEGAFSAEVLGKQAADKERSAAEDSVIANDADKIATRAETEKVARPHVSGDGSNHYAEALKMRSRARIERDSAEAYEAHAGYSKADAHRRRISAEEAEEEAKDAAAARQRAALEADTAASAEKKATLGAAHDSGIAADAHVHAELDEQSSKRLQTRADDTKADEIANLEARLEDTHRKAQDAETARGKLGEESRTASKEEARLEARAKMASMRVEGDAAPDYSYAERRVTDLRAELAAARDKLTKLRREQDAREARASLESHNAKRTGSSADEASGLSSAKRAQADSLLRSATAEDVQAQQAASERDLAAWRLENDRREERKAGKKATSASRRLPGDLAAQKRDGEALDKAQSELGIASRRVAVLGAEASEARKDAAKGGDDAVAAADRSEDDEMNLASAEAQRSALTGARDSAEIAKRDDDKRVDADRAAMQKYGQRRDDLGRAADRDLAAENDAAQRRRSHKARAEMLHAQAEAEDVSATDASLSQERHADAHRDSEQSLARHASELADGAAAVKVAEAHVADLEQRLQAARAVKSHASETLNEARLEAKTAAEEEAEARRTAGKVSVAKHRADERGEREGDKEKRISKSLRGEKLRVEEDEREAKVLAERAGKERAEAGHSERAAKKKAAVAEGASDASDAARAVEDEEATREGVARATSEGQASRARFLERRARRLEDQARVDREESAVNIQGNRDERALGREHWREHFQNSLHHNSKDYEVKIAEQIRDDAAEHVKEERTIADGDVKEAERLSLHAAEQAHRAQQEMRDERSEDQQAGDHYKQMNDHIEAATDAEYRVRSQRRGYN